MDFTREPIIETIITPKEGHKLTLRNTKISGADEYSVDALEVVTFGGMPFYRSTERPKSFLVPISDFEVMEVRELKVPLKNASFDKTIKIASKKESKDSKPKAKESATSEDTSENEEPKKKRTRRRGRKGKSSDETAAEPTDNAPASKDDSQEQIKASEKSIKPESVKEATNEQNSEESKAPKKRLVPPPTTLISETISRYKNILLNEEKAESKKPPALPKELLEEEAPVATKDSEEE